MSTHDVMSCALPRPSGVVCSRYINGGFFRVLCPRFTFQCSPSCPISVAHDMGSVLASWTPKLSYILNSTTRERAPRAFVVAKWSERRSDKWISLAVALWLKRDNLYFGELVLLPSTPHIRSSPGFPTSDINNCTNEMKCQMRKSAAPPRRPYPSGLDIFHPQSGSKLQFPLSVPPSISVVPPAAATAAEPLPQEIGGGAPDVRVGQAVEVKVLAVLEPDQHLGDGQVDAGPGHRGVHLGPHDVQKVADVGCGVQGVL